MFAEYTLLAQQLNTRSPVDKTVDRVCQFATARSIETRDPAGNVRLFFIILDSIKLVLPRFV